MDHAGRVIRLRPEESKNGRGRVVTIDGEYYLQQFQPGQGVASLGVDDAQPPEQAKHSENVF